MNKKFLIATAFFAQLAAGAALACGDDTEAQWNSPSPDTSAISIKDAQEKLKTEKHVIVKKSMLQSMCGPATYDVIDAEDNQFLGQFPTPDQDDDGRTLIVRTEQIIESASKATLARLEQAHKDFNDDNAALEAEFGVHMYDPEGTPLSYRFPDSKKQRVFVTAEFCKMIPGEGRSYPYYSSSEALSQDTFINTYQFIPGRTDYRQASIYNKGDLKRELLSNPELRKALEERAAQNASDCQPRQFENGNIWIGIQDRLAKEDLLKLLRDPFERYTRKFVNAPALKIESAELLNNNSLRITFTENSTPTKQIFSGDADAILLIEQDLARKHIKTDRDASLDMNGTLQKQYNELKSPLPVGP